MSESGQQVAIVTGGSQGIGAGLVDGYRQRGWAVVANSLHIKPSKDPDVLTVAGDISEAATADQIIGQAMDRFGRVDTLVNNAGIFLAKPFTDYTAEDYALVTGVNLAGFFWMTQRAIGQMLRQGSGHVVNISASVAGRAASTLHSPPCAIHDVLTRPWTFAKTSGRLSLPSLLMTVVTTSFILETQITSSPFL